MGSSSGKRGFTLLEVLVVCAVIVLLLLAAFHLKPFFYRSPGIRPRVVCASNLKQIGMAMHNYHDTHKRFPPAAAPMSKNR